MFVQQTVQMSCSCNRTVIAYTSVEPLCTLVYMTLWSLYGDNIDLVV